MKRRFKHLLISLLLLSGWALFQNYRHPDPLPSGTMADRLVVYKEARLLELWAQGHLVKTYHIALGRQAIGHKEYEGDRRTPEGKYSINDKNPHSAYYKNLGISYPNAQDRQHAKQLGKPPGGAIKIHGIHAKHRWWGRAHRFHDWTHGCIAVTNEEMEELYQAVSVGTVIELFP
jgi:murein L,D-transpeptidase YafK